MLAEVTNALVQLHAERYGKGPTRSKSHLIDDMLVCVMHDPFTTAEHTLIGAGKAEQVRELRLAFKEAMEGAFSGAVERITGRRVRALVSQVCVDPDTAIHVFMLDPPEG
jgi:uncharacterized protein YbcI